MTAYILRRILWTVPVLFAVLTITFVVMHNVPGGPWDAGKPLPDPARHNLNHEYGLDKPLWEQFELYLINLARGDLGVSFQSRNRPVSEVLAERIPTSAQLGLLALVVSVTVGVGLGVISALHRNSPIDYVASAFATVSASVPSFILGMLLLAVFSGYLHWLPSLGWGTPKGAVMPVLALSPLPTAYIARVTRASMLDVLQQDFVRTARAKGLRERTVVLRHILRNALIPVLSVTGPLAAAFVTGSFIVEKLFSIRGVGWLFVDSISKRDYGVVMGTTLFCATIVVISNLAVDVLYAFVDPRIRYEGHG